MSANNTKAVETIKAKGAKAYKDGLGIDSCPYKLDGKISRRYRRIWLGGYYEASNDRFDIELRAVNHYVGSKDE